MCEEMESKRWRVGILVWGKGWGSWYFGGGKEWGEGSFCGEIGSLLVGGRLVVDVVGVVEDRRQQRGFVNYENGKNWEMMMWVGGVGRVRRCAH